MSRSDLIAHLAESSAALLQDYDLTSMLIQTISEAVTVADADAGGLLVVTDTGALELLSATSHSAVALETYQAFSGEGPCQACMEDQVPLGFSRIRAGEMWPAIGDLMAAMDFEFVLAAPLRWRGTALGGLNLFWTLPPEDAVSVHAETQVFADMLTLFIVNSDPITPAAARRHIAAALQARTLLELAKGVLAEQESIEMPEAYLALRRRERESGLSLTQVAEDVIRGAHQRATGS